MEPCEARLLFDDAPHVGDFVLDRSFSNDGVADQLIPTAGFEEDDGMFFVAALPGGKVLAVGGDADTNEVVRLNHDGSFDTTYGGGDGTAGPFSLNAKRALLQTDGKLLLLGITGASIDPNSALSTVAVSVERLNS